ncbi:MAG TPA: M48 family metallopeptidase [Bacteroidales bacterium]|nr:M48 family metallopeptidase [Bacteroidales bacterium]
MNPSLLFSIIIAILVTDFLFELWLDFINYRHHSTHIPDELKGIYDEEQYSRQQEYKKANTRFGLISGIFGFLVMMIFILASGIPWADGIIRSITTHPVLMALLFFGSLMLVSDILSIPFAVYQTFVIEERFGFNKTTPLTFVLDKLKGWLLGAIIGGGLLSLIIWIYMKTPQMLWIYAWIAISIFSVLMTLVYSSIIVPLFNKQTPLEAGELRDSILQFVNKAGFKLKNIFVIDGSKRSTKANAYFTGIGPEKRIVLYDTLINDLEKTEIVAVLAHETGHYKKKHIWINLITGILQTGIILLLFSVFIGSPELSAAFGVEEHSFHIGMIAFGILFSPISFVLGIFLNLWSRKAEYQADRFAKNYGFGKELINSLKKLTQKNLGNLTPHPLYVFFHYSHPTLLQRIRAINNNEG